MSLNLYVYCHNNPIMFIDPSGHVDVGLRDYATSLGGTVGYDDSTRTASVTYNGITQCYSLDDSSVKIANDRIIIDDAEFHRQFGLSDGNNKKHIIICIDLSLLGQLRLPFINAGPQGTIGASIYYDRSADGWLNKIGLVNIPSRECGLTV